ncbi:acyl-CoA desaturase [Aquabacterium sp. A7-Y]|uniref:acyl-CoA desaturase n=1 Tax=Aquabacterium sp. A7-Y TaxID=1349605 RepID=UPI00223E4761|nr:acyl-CoA desaturase [Aquabacterium sp. A7-Y]MCW7538450.1 acyl-CoA desaturase [Aquabacterium sp. A7-Y]
MPPLSPPPVLPAGLHTHRVLAAALDEVRLGRVRWAPAKSLWFSGMAAGAVVGGAVTFSLPALLLFFVTTGTVLLLGHSLGSHRKLIHDSFQCPRWLERLLVYLGVQVGLAGPLGLLRQHELRDYAQRLPDCHDYLRHGRSFWHDAWWQLHCELQLDTPPEVRIEPRIAEDRYYRFLERTWMLQQLPWALLFYAWGGWAFVFWGVCARVTAGVTGHWLIGYFAHNHGQMHYEVQGAAVQGRNIRLTSLLTMGECWHNNHHAYPGSARLGLFAGEWDPGWWALKALERLGLASSFRLPEHLPERPELRALDPAGMGLAESVAARRYARRHPATEARHEPQARLAAGQAGRLAVDRRQCLQHGRRAGLLHGLLDGAAAGHRDLGGGAGVR